MNFKEYFRKNPPAKLSDKEEIAIKLGGLITHARLYSGFSQTKLAKKIGTQQPSLARAEAGGVVPSVEFLYKIAKAIGRDTFFLERLSYLFGLEQTKTGTETHDFIDKNISSPYFKISNNEPISVSSL